MGEISERNIKKLINGSIKDGFSFTVGQVLDKAGVTIHSIVFDSAWFYEFGEIRYDIYVTKESDKGGYFKWKSFLGQQLVLEYFL